MNSKALIFVMAAAVIIAAIVVMNASKEEAPAPVAPAPPPVAATEPARAETTTVAEAPPTETSSVPKSRIIPNGRVNVTLWTQVCKGDECGDKSRTAGRIAVNDVHGEVTKPKVTADGPPLSLHIPEGEYELIGIDSKKRRSEPKKVTVLADDTQAIDVVITKKR